MGDPESTRLDWKKRGEAGIADLPVSLDCMTQPYFRSSIFFVSLVSFTLKR